MKMTANASACFRCKAFVRLRASWEHCRPNMALFVFHEVQKPDKLQTYKHRHRRHRDIHAHPSVCSTEHEWVVQ
eukprot:1699868-Amphidinium_carterae.1